MRLVVASANPDKVAEIAEILEPVGVELEARPASVPDVVEDADTLEGNARLKAVAIADATGAAAVADEAGQTQVVKSGFLILSPEGMVELRSQIDQMLGELERRGLINLKPDKLDG